MWIFFWVFLSILVGIFAGSKSRSKFGWFFISLLISPLIAFIILLVAGPRAGSLKKCPKCAEQVKAEAEICRFCSFQFPSSPQEENLKIEEHKETSNLDLLRSRYNELNEKISRCDNASERATLTHQLSQVLDQIQKLA